MKRTVSLFIMALLVLFSFLSVAQRALAEEGKLVGTISRIEMSADQKTATVVLKDIKSSEEVTVIITDDLTLDKFKDKRIVEGDEIRCKYEKDGGKNSSKMFKKTAGC